MSHCSSKNSEWIDLFFNDADFCSFIFVAPILWTSHNETVVGVYILYSESVNMNLNMSSPHAKMAWSPPGGGWRYVYNIPLPCLRAQTEKSFVHATFRCFICVSFMMFVLPGYNLGDL